MSNKKETPVSWLVFELSKVGYLPDGLPTDIHNKALEMESKKLQKYDEMLEMLEELKGIFDKYSVDFESEFFKYKKPLEQLIKEAKEL
jgi:hypothetical protein